MVSRPILLVIALCSLLLAAPARQSAVSEKLKSYCLSIHTLQDAFLSETGGYAPSLTTLGGGGSGLPNTVDGYAAHFFGQSDGYRVSLAKPGEDTLVFSSQGTLMRGDEVLYAVPTGQSAQAKSSKDKMAEKAVSSNNKHPSAVAPITYQADTIGPIGINGRALRLIKTFAVLGKKVNWPKGIASYRIIDDRDSVLWAQQFKVSTSEEGIEAPYLNMGVAAVVGKRSSGFLVHFNMDSTSPTAVVTCSFFALHQGKLVRVAEPISFRGTIIGFNESSDSLKLGKDESFSVAVWNGRFPTLATLSIRFAIDEKGKKKGGVALTRPRIEKGYAVFDAGGKPDAGEIASGTEFSFYTNIERESSVKRKVPSASEFTVGSVFVRMKPSDLKNPQTVLSKLELESQAKTFVEVTIGGERGWVNIREIRFFGFPEAG